MIKEEARGRLCIPNFNWEIIVTNYYCMCCGKQPLFESTSWSFFCGACGSETLSLNDGKIEIKQCDDFISNFLPVVMVEYQKYLKSKEQQGLGG